MDVALVDSSIIASTMLHANLVCEIAEITLKKCISCIAAL
jgi:hypothetical protein